MKIFKIHTTYVKAEFLIQAIKIYLGYWGEDFFDLPNDFEILEVSQKDLQETDFVIDSKSEFEF